jgi:hypothetical protein
VERKIGNACPLHHVDITTPTRGSPMDTSAPATAIRSSESRSQERLLAVTLVHCPPRSTGDAPVPIASDFSVSLMAARLRSSLCRALPSLQWTFLPRS